MASWTNDAQIHTLMRKYLAAVARYDEASERRLPSAELDRLRDEKRDAARDYEEALISRGWQIPGLAIGPLARAARW
jgi:hypothetical protein